MIPNLTNESEMARKGKALELAEKHQCCGRVTYGDWGRTKQCLRTGILEHEGKHYCKTHHPPSKKEQDEKRQAAYRAEHSRMVEERERKAKERLELERKAGEYEKLCAELCRQHAEIEALKKDIDHKDAYCEQLGRELSKATAEIEALRKDADRWREWRKGKPLTVEIPTPTDEKPNRKTTLIFGPNQEPNYGEALDAAIDASMGEKA
jgi:predicted RNase H-like nuclease (RuvC/YqgF family)